MAKWATRALVICYEVLQHCESKISNSFHTFSPMWQITARSTKWSLIFCSWGPTNLSTISPLLSIRSSLLPPNTQHRGCAWVKHYNSSRKWPFLRNFQGAVKGRRLMPGQALQGTWTPPHFSLLYPFLSTPSSSPLIIRTKRTMACPMQTKDSVTESL